MTAILTRDTRSPFCVPFPPFCSPSRGYDVTSESSSIQDLSSLSMESSLTTAAILCPIPAILQPSSWLWRHFRVVVFTICPALPRPPFSSPFPPFLSRSRHFAAQHVDMTSLPRRLLFKICPAWAWSPALPWGQSALSQYPAARQQPTWTIEKKIKHLIISELSWLRETG